MLQVAKTNAVLLELHKVHVCIYMLRVKNEALGGEKNCI